MEVGTTQGIRAFPTMRLFKKGEAAAKSGRDMGMMLGRK